VTISPKAHDEAEAALFDELAKAERTLRYKADQVHHDAGDKRDYCQRNHPWGMAPSVAYEKSSPIARVEYDQAKRAFKRIGEQIGAMEEIYREQRWTRFFPCRNADGHIHSSLRGCSTVYATTPMGWYPNLSGKTAEDAVAELGPALCSVCFPSAPVEHRSKTLGQVERDKTKGARDAAKAERDAKKAAKTLTPEQRFTDGRIGRGGRGDWVETVYRCKEVLREAMEFKHYSGPNDHHCWYETTLVAAEQAKAVLLAREAANPGTGATQAEIDKIQRNAERKQLAYFK
jgi:hypothetical protein